MWSYLYKKTDRQKYRDVHVNKIGTQADKQQELQDDVSRATRTIAQRVEKCIEVDGGIFEHLFWTVAIYWDHLHNQ